MQFPSCSQSSSVDAKRWPFYEADIRPQDCLAKNTPPRTRDLTITHPSAVSTEIRARVEILNHFLHPNPEPTSIHLLCIVKQPSTVARDEESARLRKIFRSRFDHDLAIRTKRELAHGRLVWYPPLRCPLDSTPVTENSRPIGRFHSHGIPHGEIRFCIPEGGRGGFEAEKAHCDLV